MVITLCLLPVPPPPIWSGSQSAKQYFKKSPTTSTPPSIFVQSILLLLSKSLIHADVLRVLILTTSKAILTDNFSTSNYFYPYPSETGKWFFSSGDIDNSMLFRTVLFWEQYNGRLQTSSEEKHRICACHKSHMWGMLTLSSGDVPVWLHLGFAAFWMGCRTDWVSYVHCSLSHLCYFLYGAVKEGFAKTCKLNHWTFQIMLRSVFTFFERLIFIVF